MHYEIAGTPSDSQWKSHSTKRPSSFNLILSKPMISFIYFFTPLDTMAKHLARRKKTTSSHAASQAPETGLLVIWFLIVCIRACNRANAPAPAVNFQQPRRVIATEPVQRQTIRPPPQPQPQPYLQPQPAVAAPLPTKPCVKCTAPVGQGVRFCTTCGTDQNTSTPCHFCNTNLSPSAAFCYNCGHARASAPEAAPPSYTAIN